MTADRDTAERAFGGVVRHAQAAVVKEADEAAPAVEAVANSFRGLAVGRQLRPLRMQPELQFGDKRPAAFGAHAPTLRRRLAVDVALDLKQRIDAFDRLHRDWRLVEPRHVEELPPRVGPAHRRRNRSWLAAGLKEPVEARIGVRLHQAGIGREVSIGMYTAAIGRIEERCRRRGWPGERAVVAHVSPQPAGPALALRQHLHGGDRKSTRLNSSHGYMSYAVFCLKKKKMLRAASLSDSTKVTPASVKKNTDK